MGKRGIFIVLVVLGLVITAGLIAISAYAEPNAAVQVSFINVGQGDSALIHDSSGFDVWIDGGKSSAIIEPLRRGE
jgi:beta-lactamase superfamily II metal-dependent hydrolase